jgi:peptidoglycan/LPS O-acetylase OafA/YrhL
VAILAVLVHHTMKACGFDGWLMWRGAMGVDIFFAISGLLITSQLLENSNLKHFYIRRAFRILPPAMLYLAVVFALGLIGRTEVMQCLLIHRNYTDGTVFGGHFWSLSLEEQFYLVWPLILVFAGERAPGVAFAVIVCVGAWRGFALSHESLWYIRTELRCDGLLWGCLSAFWLRREIVKPRQWQCIGLMLMAVVIWASPVFLPVMPLFVTLAVLGTVQQPSWQLSRLLESKPLVWIGQRSYGIYLWQQLFIFAPVRMPIVLRLAAAFLWPALLYRFMESPLRDLGRRLARPFGRPKAAAIAEPAV